MKKILAVFCLFCLLSAFSWPPDNYEMPRTVLDAATVEESLSGLKITAGSIGNIGLVLIGIIISVSLISTIFKRLFLDKVDSSHPLRGRKNPSRFRSSAPLVDSRIRENEIGSLGRSRLRKMGRRREE